MLWVLQLGSPISSARGFGHGVMRHAPGAVSLADVVLDHQRLEIDLASVFTGGPSGD